MNQVRRLQAPWLHSPLAKKCLQLVFTRNAASCSMYAGRFPSSLPTITLAKAGSLHASNCTSRCGPRSHRPLLRAHAKIGAGGAHLPVSWLLSTIRMRMEGRCPGHPAGMLLPSLLSPRRKSSRLGGSVDAGGREPWSPFPRMWLQQWMPAMPDWEPFKADPIPK